MLTVADAQEKVLEGLKRLGSEQVSVAAAAGRTLAADVAANRTQPPFDVSAMDGYAVRAQDVTNLPATLKVVGSVAAGAIFERSVAKGEAVRIFTGAPVPKGANTIVIQENTKVEGENVYVVDGAAPAGRHIRRAGLDFKKGDKLLKAGRVLTSRDVSLAASMNHAALPCVRQPRIAILATGDELVPPGGDPGPAQIIASTSAGLGANALAWGATIRDLGIARDRIDDIRFKAAASDGADLFVTLGGASVGDHDLVQKALVPELKVSFWKIAMRPGKPLIFGKYRSMPFLGLPGNPVSAFVCAQLFLKPMIAKLLGRDDAQTPLTARLAGTLAANEQRQDYVRCGLRTESDGTLTAEPFPVQDSSMLRLLAHADGLIVRPPGDPARADGDAVAVLRLD
ncbi:MAG: molybdopterin molybdotransferase MoeA [Alphaproteobacteria bacterium]|nr:molybdopterin molybdotransferase MoeA [Alphaproteobacteria bacterium]